jgi:hypothetical protein
MCSTPATVYFSPPLGSNSAGDATPPAVLPPEAYAEMAPTLHSPPVMSRVSYRPTTGADGHSANRAGISFGYGYAERPTAFTDPQLAGAGMT